MPDTSTDDAEVARYIADRCTEALQLLRGRSELQRLVRLVNTARLEAERVARDAEHRSDSGGP